MMWNIRRLLLCVSITICLLPSTGSFPVQQNDIIAGKEFLSLISHKDEQNSFTQDDIRSAIEKPLDETRLPIEKMFEEMDDAEDDDKSIPTPNITKEIPSVKTDVKVISVSVSSSVMQAGPTGMVSNSHKTDFSIEETDPFTTQPKDNFKSESKNVESIIPAPSHIRSRTQRKQDGSAPYQTIIYHDLQGKNTDPNSRPVSYSSVQQWQESVIPIRANVYSEPAKIYSEPAKFYGEPAKVYSEPAKVYGEPAKVYGEPEKIYGEQAKIYSEPAKIYSEPSKIYSEPAKTYGEPSKVYSEPSKIYYEPVQTTTPLPPPPSTTRKIIFNLDKLPYDLLNAPMEGSDPLFGNNGASSRYEPTHKNSIEHFSKVVKNPSPHKLNLSHHRPTTTTTINHQQVTTTPVIDTTDKINDNVPTTTTTTTTMGNPLVENVDDDSQKIGYVLEGRNFRKYRVEEKTPDGFIVGEYGIVSHNDGSLRGVRYTADSNTNPKLIYDALLKFLSL